MLGHPTLDEVSTESLAIVADWLDTCLECGEIHEQRPVDPARTDPKALHTWAHPDDGHVYRRRRDFERTAVADEVRRRIAEERT